MEFGGALRSRRAVVPARKLNVRLLEYAQFACWPRATAGH
eukprot:SAG25_NODE_9611_length_365_cov_1.338346_1_plen_39_part_10